MNPINEVLQSTAQALGQSRASVFADLERLAEATAQILGAPGTSRTKLESLRPRRGKLVFIPHNLNPASINYCAYTEMTWYERPVAVAGADLSMESSSAPSCSTSSARTNTSP